MRLASGIAALLAIASASAPADASMPSCPSRIALAPRTFVSASPGLTVTGVSLRVACAAATWPRCAVEAEIAVLNTTKEPIYGRLLLEDTPAVRFASPPIPVAASPSERRTVGARGEIALLGGVLSRSSEPVACGGESPRPMHYRHFFLVSRGEQYTASLPLPTGTAVSVALSFQPGWSMEIVTHGQQAEGKAGTLSVTSTSGSSRGLEIRRNIAPSPLRAGGPFIAAGGSRFLGKGLTGDAARWRPRLRAGYEFAAPWFLVHSLAVETDLRSFTVVPAIEAAVQAFSLGVGTPIRFVDTTAVGVRGQFGFNFPVVGFVATVDYYPSISEARGRTVGTLFGQLAF